MLRKTLVAMALAFSSVVWAETPVINTENGRLQGIEHGKMNAYLGIPYAKPPVAELRWMPPVKAEKWDGVKQVTQLASQCAQNDDLGVFANKGGSEDCLYLNVYVNKKAAAKHKKLSVFVWIHGGGLMVGSANDYDPSKLVEKGEGIVVTLNYRLGALGFLSQPALNAEKAENTNYGFMDQSLALAWVKDNIAAFGGDVDNITLAGESSGAHSVFAHVVSPYSANKFQYAITMSGSNIVTKFGANPHTLAEATEFGKGFTKALGCAENDVKCLRDKPLEEILKVQTPYIVRRPIIDGNFLPTTFAEAFKQGKVNAKVLVNGNNLDEGTFFSGIIENRTGKAIDEQKYPALIKEMFGDKAGAVLKAYPLENFHNPAEAYAKVFTDSVFACPAMQIDSELAQKIPVYAYEFADRTAPSYLKEITLDTDAAHTYEIPYLFKGFNGSSKADTSLNAVQNKLADQMLEIWTSVKDLNKIEPDWHTFNAKKQNVLTFNLPTSKVVEGKFSQTHRCDFWKKEGLY